MYYLHGQPTERVIFPRGHEIHLITSLPFRNFHRVTVTLSVANKRKAVVNKYVCRGARGTQRDIFV